MASTSCARSWRRRALRGQSAPSVKARITCGSARSKFTARTTCAAMSGLLGGMEHATGACAGAVLGRRSGRSERARCGTTVKGARDSRSLPSPRPLTQAHASGSLAPSFPTQPWDLISLVLNRALLSTREWPPSLSRPSPSRSSGGHATRDASIRHGSTLLG